MHSRNMMDLRQVQLKHQLLNNYKCESPVKSFDDFTGLFCVEVNDHGMGGIYVGSGFYISYCLDKNQTIFALKKAWK